MQIGEPTHVESEQMIPLDDIVPANLYTQDDAMFLLGDGFTKKAAREAICEACRSGDLPAKEWRRRYWFTGRDFLEWVRRWFGEKGLQRDNPAPCNPEPDMGQCSVDQPIGRARHQRKGGAE